ncbi:MAG TPA: hypothetical protein VMT03_20120 [Polyangia bacterium]|nr:hypothetical protein [Polyangia bacterium]
MPARALNGFLGLWLFFSAFLWNQTPVQRWNGWVVGALAVTGALAGMSGVKWGRYLNVALGGWLILSAIFLARRQAVPFWNDLLAGFAMVLLALVATPGDLRRRRTADI